MKPFMLTQKDIQPDSSVCLPVYSTINIRENIAMRTGILRSTMLGAVLLASMNLMPATAAEVLYATGGGSPLGLSGLHTLDPHTGANQLLWGFQNVHFYNGGLAYDPASDLLYATGAWDASTGTSTLFSINRYTGALAEVGPMGSGINLTSGGLAVHPQTGVMYATGTNGFQSSALFTVDKTSGAATLVGQSGGQCCSAPFGFNMNGLGFASDGTLFANGFTLSNTSSHLYTLNLSNGLATDIGAHGTNVGRDLKYSGLAFAADGTLFSLGSYDAASGALFTVNALTGAATSLTPPGPYASGPVHFGVDGGLVFAPSVPAPGSIYLLLTGLAAMLTWRQAHRRTLLPSISPLKAYSSP